jgi:DNA-binding IclR family transcriptional regulator
MSLTSEQAARLFALPKDVCRRILEELVAAGVLSRKWEGRYVTFRHHARSLTRG